ncbi:MAG TPA: hypothetical protein DDX06_04720 [Curvibacter sp.]|nr:hypothetical protein [Curvibacter sp.]
MRPFLPRPARSLQRSVHSVVACLLLGVLDATAQTADLTDLNFEDLAAIEVSSASKFIQSAREAPSSVEVLGREEIRRYGWRTLSEALASFTGVYITSDRAYEYIGARGFLVPGDYVSRFLIMIDGQRVNDNVYEQGIIGTDFPLDLALVERIEYVPGPGSSIYGSNAVFGVVNVITRRAQELPAATFATRLANDGWREGRVTLARQLDTGASLLLSVSERHKGGRDLSYNDPNGGLLLLGGGVSPDGVARDLDRQRSSQWFVRYEDGPFSLTARLADRTIQPSSALYGTLFNDAGLRLRDASSSLMARYQKQLSDSLGIDARLERGAMIYRADYPYDDGAGGRYINHDDTAGVWWNGDIRFFHTGLQGHKIVAGVDAQVDQQARQSNADVGVAINTPVSVDVRRQRRAVYLQDEWAFAQRWRLNAGLRYDSFSIGEQTTSPRLGLIWLARTSTTFKLLTGRAYRVPNAYERDYGGGTYNVANLALRPETIRSRELVWEEQLDRSSHLRLSVFDNTLDKLIVQVDTGGGLLQYQNQTGVQSKGVETTWRKSFEGGAQVVSGLSVNDTVDASGQRPGYSPSWVARLRGSVPWSGSPWMLSSELRALAATQYTQGGNSQRLGSQVQMNLALTTTRLAPGLEALLRIRNLMDRRLAYPGTEEAPVPALPAEGRVWEVGLRYAF